MNTSLIIFLIIITFVISVLSISFNVTLFMHINKLCDSYTKRMNEIYDHAYNYHLHSIEIIQKNINNNETEKFNKR